MKSFALAGFALVAVFSITACDPKPKTRPEPAAGPRTTQTETRPGSATLDPEEPNTRTTTTTTREATETKPPGNVIPEPTPRKNPEYGVKINGKPGYVTSPYDASGRPIDVRGLPPGTEVEDPYTPGRTLLVP